MERCVEKQIILSVERVLAQCCYGQIRLRNMVSKLNDMTMLSNEYNLAIS